MVVRWTLEDTASNDDYVFEVNPNDYTTPGITKTLETVGTAGPGGITLLFEGRDAVPTLSATGVTRTKVAHDALLNWARVRRQVRLTTHLGERFWIYITKFTPKTVRSRQAPWKRTYTLEAIVLEIDDTGDVESNPITIPAGAVRWTMEAGSDDYTFAANPNEYSPPAVTKSIAYSARSGPDGSIVLHEKRDEAPTLSISGTTLTKTAHDALMEWADKRRTVEITTHLGERFEVYITSLQPKPNRIAMAPWKRTYDLEAVVLRTLDTGDPEPDASGGDAFVPDPAITVESVTVGPTVLTGSGTGLNPFSTVIFPVRALTGEYFFNHQNVNIDGEISITMHFSVHGPSDTLAEAHALAEAGLGITIPTLALGDLYINSTGTTWASRVTGADQYVEDIDLLVGTAHVSAGSSTSDVAATATGWEPFAVVTFIVRLGTDEYAVLTNTADGSGYIASFDVLAPYASLAAADFAAGDLGLTLGDAAAYGVVHAGVVTGTDWYTDPPAELVGTIDVESAINVGTVVVSATGTGWDPGTQVTFAVRLENGQYGGVVATMDGTGNAIASIVETGPFSLLAQVGESYTPQIIGLELGNAYAYGDLHADVVTDADHYDAPPRVITVTSAATGYTIHATGVGLFPDATYMFSVRAADALYYIVVTDSLSGLDGTFTLVDPGVNGPYTTIELLTADFPDHVLGVGSFYGEIDPVLTVVGADQYVPPAELVGTVTVTSATFEDPDVVVVASATGWDPDTIVSFAVRLLDGTYAAVELVMDEEGDDVGSLSVTGPFATLAEVEDGYSTPIAGLTLGNAYAYDELHADVVTGADQYAPSPPVASFNTSDGAFTASGLTPDDSIIVPVRVDDGSFWILSYYVEVDGTADTTGENYAFYGPGTSITEALEFVGWAGITFPTLALGDLYAFTFSYADDLYTVVSDHLWEGVVADADQYDDGLVLEPAAVISDTDLVPNATDIPNGVMVVIPARAYDGNYFMVNTNTYYRTSHVLSNPDDFGFVGGSATLADAGAELLSSEGVTLPGTPALGDLFLVPRDGPDAWGTPVLYAAAVTGADQYVGVPTPAIAATVDGDWFTATSSGLRSRWMVAFLVKLPDSTFVVVQGTNHVDGSLEDFFMGSDPQASATEALDQFEIDSEYTLPALALGDLFQAQQTNEGWSTTATQTDVGVVTGADLS